MRKIYFGQLLLPVALLIGLIASVQRASAGDDVEAAPESLSVPAATPDVLWVQVSECIQYALKNNGLNKVLNWTAKAIYPCAYVDAPMGTNGLIGAGYTALKDIDPKKSAAFITLPSKIVSGIEDPQVDFFAGASSSSSYSFNYWGDAWSLRASTVVVAAGKKLADTQLGLAVNSEFGRTNNQLHIHMACLEKSVQQILASSKITTSWSKSPIKMPAATGGHSYYAMLFTTLTKENPFQLMQAAPGYTKPGVVTLVLAGAPNGYYLLEDYASAADKGTGEELLDQTCAQK
jgi:CDP-diacylglycerol pyrophosphatase